jgi:hypothetical protein
MPEAIMSDHRGPHLFGLAQIHDTEALIALLNEAGGRLSGVDAGGAPFLAVVEGLTERAYFDGRSVGSGRALALLRFPVHVVRAVTLPPTQTGRPYQR